jgi:hypothetical protein
MQHGYKIEKYEKALRISKEEENLHRMLQRESRYLVHYYFRAKFDNSITSIAEMLSGLGWNQEYYPHQNSEWCAIVKQPKELTPRSEYLTFLPYYFETNCDHQPGMLSAQS